MAKFRKLPEITQPVKMLMTGNEAIAIGAREAGVYFASAYPGTPSTEILETFGRLPGVKAQWSVNEKTAFEAGVGSSMAGARTLVCMKHVGVNVAMDPLMTFAYTGAVGGFVLVSADDPSMHSSQNEQDNRILAKFAKIPMLEPSDSAEAHAFVKLAVTLSEDFQTPVMLRVTTRISHAKGIVHLNPWPVPKVTGFVRNAPRFVMVPQFARLRHTEVEARLIRLAKYSESVPINRIEKGVGDVGIVTGGISYAHVREIMPDAPVFKIGMSNPMPIEAIREFASHYKRLIVVEELEPFYEDQIKAAGIKCEGKQFFPIEGELDPDVVTDGFRAAGVLNGSIPKFHPVKIDVIPRPPVLCAGCPHRPVFNALKKMKADVFGDIGCYTLGALAPIEALHACVCMGASIGMAAGVGAVEGSKRPVVAVIGDSTFLHSGITGLLDAVYNHAPLTLIILDNRITAMTGGQEHPGSGMTLQGEESFNVDYVALVKALGVKHIFLPDAYNFDESLETIKKAVALGEPSVILTSRPCMLYPGKRKYETFDVKLDLCNGCAACVRIGCPAISLIAETTEKGLNKIAINADACTGCSLCMQVCPVDAIITHSGNKPIVFEEKADAECGGCV
jgi:indolepyruvate ferredoxin oxidoreductase alpha subunit